MIDPREQRLRLQLSAEGRPGLYDLLAEAKGAVIAERWTIADLLAIGRQSFVFTAEDGDGLVAIKQPAFDYRRPIAYSRDDAARARARLKREHEVLEANRSRHMPEPIALSSAPPIAPAAKRSAVLGTEELFLVEELIEGATLSELGLSIWPGLRTIERERAAARIAREFIEFFRSLRSNGWFHPDISASNLIIEKSGALRVVDAGSGFTPAFTTPLIYARWMAGEKPRADLSSVLPSLAKVLHFAMSKKEPLNGAYPDLMVLEKLGYSEPCIVALRTMLALDEDPSRIVDAEDALAAWSSVVR